MNALIFIGLFVAYIFVGIVVLSALCTDGESGDDFACFLLVLFWPIAVACMILVGAGVLAWKIGKFFRGLFE